MTHDHPYKKNISKNFPKVKKVGLSFEFCVLHAIQKSRCLSGVTGNMRLPPLFTRCFPIGALHVFLASDRHTILRGGAMGYRVDYQPIKKVRNMEKRVTHVPVFAGLCLLLFFFLVFSCWPQGVEVIKEIMIPGEPDITIAAMEQLSVLLMDGERFGEAFEVFCRTVAEGSQVD